MFRTRYPVSSSTSRAAVSIGSSFSSSRPPGNSQFQMSGTKRWRQDIRTLPLLSSSTTVIAAGGRANMWCSKRSPDGNSTSARASLTHALS